MGEGGTFFSYHRMSLKNINGCMSSLLLNIPNNIKNAFICYIWCSLYIYNVSSTSIHPVDHRTLLLSTNFKVGYLTISKLAPQQFIRSLMLYWPKRASLMDLLPIVLVLMQHISYYNECRTQITPTVYF